MTAPVQPSTGEDAGQITLLVRRTIAAPVERVFAAWTEPERLRTWWGPPGVSCPVAEVDLRKGGHYRLANQMADGSMLWIQGTFLEVSPPHKLVYTWALQDPEAPAAHTRVTVRFLAQQQQTEVVVSHELFDSARVRDHHALGWEGCLRELAALLAQHPPAHTS